MVIIAQETKQNDSSSSEEDEIEKSDKKMIYISRRESFL
jgi:hypothetical protein